MKLVNLVKTVTSVTLEMSLEDLKEIVEVLGEKPVCVGRETSLYEKLYFILKEVQKDAD